MPHRRLVIGRGGELIRPILTLIKYMVPWIYMSQPPNRLSIGSAVFAQLTRVLSTHRHTHTDHATCNIYST